jgi:hypothetical protein
MEIRHRLIKLVRYTKEVEIHLHENKRKLIFNSVTISAHGLLL